jgi:hypothetical protein
MGMNHDDGTDAVGASVNRSPYVLGTLINLQVSALLAARYVVMKFCGNQLFFCLQLPFLNGVYINADALMYRQKTS